MEKKLTDELKKSGLNPRTERNLTLFPECLFGFPPPHLTEMLERLDCAACQGILAASERLAARHDALLAQVGAFQAPVRRRNEERHRKRETWRRVPLIGRFVRPARPEAMPDHRFQPWYGPMQEAVDEAMRGFDALCAADPAHWSDEKKRAIGIELVSRHLGKDSTIIISGGP